MTAEAPGAGSISPKPSGEDGRFAAQAAVLNAAGQNAIIGFHLSAGEEVDIQDRDGNRRNVTAEAGYQFMGPGLAIVGVADPTGLASEDEVMRSGWVSSFDASKHGAVDSIAFLPLGTVVAEKKATMHVTSEWQKQRRAGILGRFGLKERVAVDIEHFSTRTVQRFEPYTIERPSGEREPAYSVSYRLHGVPELTDADGAPGKGMLTAAAIVPKSHADAFLAEILPPKGSAGRSGRIFEAHHFVRRLLLDNSPTLYWRLSDLNANNRELNTPLTVVVPAENQRPGVYDLIELPPSVGSHGATPTTKRVREK